LKVPSPGKTSLTASGESLLLWEDLSYLSFAAKTGDSFLKLKFFPCEGGGVISHLKHFLFTPTEYHPKLPEGNLPLGLLLHENPVMEGIFFLGCVSFE